MPENKSPTQHCSDAELLVRINDIATVMRNAEYTIAMTGAGMSVESGIPPFRGADGLWTRYGTPPMDGCSQFRKDPTGWWNRRTTSSRAGCNGAGVCAGGSDRSDDYGRARTSYSDRRRRQLHPQSRCACRRLPARRGDGYMDGDRWRRHSGDGHATGYGQRYDYANHHVTA